VQNNRLQADSCTISRNWAAPTKDKAVERICQKCERGGRPHKFPVPGNAYHALLVDFRTFLNGGDKFDRIHVGLGGEFVPGEFHRRYWNGRLISGVFSSRTGIRGAEIIRERVHFLGFVREREYGVGAFGPAIQFIGNPNLFEIRCTKRLRSGRCSPSGS
jgi:hypothetical protein